MAPRFEPIEFQYDVLKSPLPLSPHRLNYLTDVIAQVRAPPPAEIVHEEKSIIAIVPIETQIENNIRPEEIVFCKSNEWW